MARGGKYRQDPTTQDQQKTNSIEKPQIKKTRTGKNTNTRIKHNAKRRFSIINRLIALPDRKCTQKQENSKPQRKRNTAVAVITGKKREEGTSRCSPSPFESTHHQALRIFSEPLVVGVYRGHPNVPRTHHLHTSYRDNSPSSGPVP